MSDEMLALGAQPEEVVEAVIEPPVNGESDETVPAEPEPVESASEEACDAQEDSCDKMETSSVEEESKGEAPQTSESNDDSNTPKTSRELKSILALSKEANLDTNITNRRKSSGKTTPKRAKMTGFPVTAESELEIFDNKMDDKKGKKRKLSVEEGATNDDFRRGSQGYYDDFVMSRKPNKDTFCWRCHHDCVQVACETCPRAYHLRCLKQIIVDREHWPCPECVGILKAENVQTRSAAMRGMTLEHLCNLLKFAVKRMIQCNGSEPFMHAVDEKQFPEYGNYIVQPMTLSMLEKNIKENAYGSTQAFEADAKWILHNSIIFNSYFPDQSKLTSAAKTIVKICKQEMAEIENCPSCYLNANTKKHTWFVEVCPKPHLLVWAKLKGFPYWPAKVMSVNSSGMADVRFFGAHDKAWVSVKDCYLYSVKDPNSGKQKRNDIIECVKELDRYVDNLKKIYGKVNLAPFKAPLEADSSLTQLQVFLPGYKNDGKDVVWTTEIKSEDESDSSDEEGDEEDEDEVEEEEEEEEVEEEGSDQKTRMTRIDYTSNSSSEKKLVAKPIRAIVVRKRDSSDVSSLNNSSTSVSPKVSTDENHVTLKNNQEKEESPTKTVPKIRISDQLMKKLDIKETETTEKAEGEKTDPKPNNVNESVVIDASEKEERPSEALQVEEKEKSVEQKDETKEKAEKNDVLPKKETTVKIINTSQLKANTIKSMDKSVTITKITETKKRKLDEGNKEESIFPPNKMVKLVPIENILQKKDPPSETSAPSKSEQLIVLKEVRVVKDGKEIKNKKADEESPVKVKNEVESDDDSDVQYMEAKRQYLSALNISEKQKIPVKPKTHEIRTRSKTEEKKIRAETPKSAEIYVKSLSKIQQTPKHKARKSFPTPNYSKKTIVARKIVPKTTIDDELTLVNATTLQPTGNVMILPKLQYSKPKDMSTPPLLAMLPRPQLDQNKKLVEGSQNYIPQNEEDAVPNGGGVILNNLLTAAAPLPPQPAPPIIDLDTQPTPIDTELGALKEIIPENVSKGVNDILCQPPPKLKPKPTGILNREVEAAVPSTAGPVASRINSMAQKLSDYFRSLLVETISELGKSQNPEATISGLKYEIEELNHKHSIELSEIRKNVSIVLKDIQKSVVEERERIINETKANCEMEMMKKVEEAKSKQWCANCSKEAQFYCCWNTSYCDYPCQQKHWPKHMSKCTQANQAVGAQATTTNNTAVRPAQGQQLVLTPASAPKFGTLFAKPQKVYLKRAGQPFKPPTSHITLVESTPGNFELLGSGPIAVNGKILASTSVIEKIKSGNIVTVTAPSGATNTQLTSANQKVNIVPKSTVNSVVTDGAH